MPKREVPETRRLTRLQIVRHGHLVPYGDVGTEVETMRHRKRVLVVRSDNDGDVLLAGPAIRAVAAHAHVTLLCGPRGKQAAEILPGIDDIIVKELPWIDPQPQQVTWHWLADAVATLRTYRFDQAVILTSFHQSALPLAMVLRAAGVPHITATSEDYPGSLLDVRVPVIAREHEVTRALRIARAAGFPLPHDDEGLLEIRPELVAGIDKSDTIVIHPGASIVTRMIPAHIARATVDALAHSGVDVLVTGSAQERALTTYVAGDQATDLGGQTPDLASLARVLAGAKALIVGNTGAAHLAAAVGTPVVSIFAPIVPWHSWHPWGVAVTRFGDQNAACKLTRARHCPIPEHPCVSDINAHEVAEAALQHLAEEAPWQPSMS